MNSYEVLYIVKPDMEEEARVALISKFSELVTNNGGEDVYKRQAIEWTAEPSGQVIPVFFLRTILG